MADCETGDGTKHQNELQYEAVVCRPEKQKKLEF